MTQAGVSRETKKVVRVLPRPIVWPVAQWLPRVAETAEACGLALTEPQLTQLAQFLALLQHWNSVYNLTALREPAEMLTHHLADCLVVVPPLLRHVQTLPNDVPHVLDVGSGGGLPGVVLAVVCERIRVTCVDAVGKKAAFVRQVAAALGLSRLRAEHARVENLRGAYEVITSRAFASLPDFVRLTKEQLLPGTGIWLAMKGQPPEASDEVALLPQQVSIFAVESLRVPNLDAQRCLVWMRQGVPQ